MVGKFIMGFDLRALTKLKPADGYCLLSFWYQVIIPRSMITTINIFSVCWARALYNHSAREPFLERSSENWTRETFSKLVTFHADTFLVSYFALCSLPFFPLLSLSLPLSPESLFSASTSPPLWLFIQWLINLIVFLIKLRFLGWQLQNYLYGIKYTCNFRVNISD